MRAAASAISRVFIVNLCISDSHKISDYIPRICRNDASKLAPSLHERHNPRLTAARFFSKVIFETTRPLTDFLASILLAQ
jgi:hypothetical protein